MSLCKLGKNRQLDLPSNELNISLKNYKENYYKIINNIYHYTIKDTIGLSSLPNYKPQTISTRNYEYKYLGQILGIIPINKNSDINGNNITEFYWFDDPKEYTDEELDLVDTGRCELPVCNYGCGLNKRIFSFI